MNATRFDLYAKVHKGQRERLFSLSMQAGRADVLDDEEVAALGGQIEAMLGELHEHGEHEDRHIHPVLREVAPPVLEQLDDEHAALETAMGRLRAALAGLSRAAGTERRSAGRELYLELNAFVATYLAHLDREERQAMPALWAGCDDARVMAVMAGFIAARSPQQRLDDLVLMLPSLNPQERAEVLRGSRTNAEAYGHALDAAKGVLDEGDWKRLQADLEE